MDRLSGVLNLSRLEKILYGPGQVAAIGQELEARGLQRALVVTGRTLGNSPLLDTLVTALGDRCAGVFRGVAEHVQAPSVRALVSDIERTGADVLISFGGGSTTDASKVAIASVLADRDLTQEASTQFYQNTQIRTAGRQIAHFAVPTTLSAGEYSFGAATTDDQGRKGVIIDYRIGPTVVINDAEMAMATPDRLWLSSGVKCLDHAIEALYSAHGDTLTDALASNALRLLLENLAASVSTQGTERLSHRGLCQTAAFLSNYAASNTRYGLSHAVGHKIGPRWHVPHGVTSCIALPPSMRFMARVAPERFGSIAEILGVGHAQDKTARALECADKVADFIAGLGMPTRLQEFDVKKSDLDDVVPMLHDQMTQSGTIGRPVSIAEMSEVVHACW